MSDSAKAPENQTRISPGNATLEGYGQKLVKRPIDLVNDHDHRGETIVTMWIKDKPHVAWVKTADLKKAVEQLADF